MAFMAPSTMSSCRHAVGRRRRECGVVVVAENESEPQRGDGVNELGRDDRRDGVGVVVEVRELALHVAVVDVDRDGAQLEARVERFDPLGAVHGVDRHVVTCDDAVLGEVIGQPAGPLVELPVRQLSVGRDQCRLVGNGVGEHLDDVAEVDAAIGHGSSVRRRVTRREVSRHPASVRAATSS
jgi:hypothetical protein